MLLAKHGENIMEVKKVKNGWEFSGITFSDKASALKAKKSEDTKMPSYIKNNAKLDVIFDKDHQTSFGILISEYIARNKRSMSAIAKDLHVSRQALYNWINGSSLPTTEKAEYIMKVLNCTPARLAKAIDTNLKFHRAKIVGLTVEELLEA